MDKQSRLELVKASELAYQAGEYSKVVEQLTELIVYEKNPEHYYRRSLSYLQLNEGDLAFKDLNHIVDLEPENTFWLACRAYVHDKLGRVDAAVEDYERVIKMDPEDAVAFNNLGLLYEKQGRIEEAKKLVKQADLMDEAKEFRRNPPKDEHEPFAIAPPKKNVAGIFKAVLSKKSELLEFLKFVRNGFKLKD